MATYAAFKHVELHKIGYGKNRVPNAPRGCISEIFSENGVSKPAANGASNGSSNGAPRSPREAAARPRDTHSRLFGQSARAPAAPALLTDTLRSNIRFGDDAAALRSRSPSGATTPTRASFTPPRRNPVTGDGCNLPPVRRRQSCRTRGAFYSHPPLSYQLDSTMTLPYHYYYTHPLDWPPVPTTYNVASESRFKPSYRHIDPLTFLDVAPSFPLHKYDYPLDKGGLVSDYTLLQTPVVPGPHTLATPVPTFTRHVPGYLFDVRCYRNDLSKTYFMNYALERQFEGNPITGDGYKSINGEINTAVTALNGNAMPINHNRIPPGGYSSGLW